MRLTIFALLLAASQATSAQEVIPTLSPTERYGVEWGDTPEAVIDKSDRQPDSTEPAGTLTFLGANGGQTIYTFAAGGLAVILEASPLISDSELALGEYGRYKAALIAMYGPPVLEDSDRDGDVVPPIIDTVWTPGGEIRAVELTLDSVPQGEALSHFFYIRTVGPDLNESSEE